MCMHVPVSVSVCLCLSLSLPLLSNGTLGHATATKTKRPTEDVFFTLLANLQRTFATGPWPPQPIRALLFGTSPNLW